MLTVIVMNPPSAWLPCNHHGIRDAVAWGHPPHQFTSAMHMGWMRAVGGRLKSDYSYSPSIYNSFPWPAMTAAKRKEIETLAQAVLDARADFPTSTLEDLYDPDAMPPVLRKAHEALDKAVDRLYRRSSFRFERERVEHLFQLFEQGAAPLDPTISAETKRKRRAAG